MLDFAARHKKRVQASGDLAKDAHLVLECGGRVMAADSSDVLTVAALRRDPRAVRRRRSTRRSARNVADALAEDVGAGDQTGRLVPADDARTARIIVREEAVLCGVPWFDEVMRASIRRSKSNGSIAKATAWPRIRPSCCCTAPRVRC